MIVWSCDVTSGPPLVLLWPLQGNVSILEESGAKHCPPEFQGTGSCQDGNLGRWYLHLIEMGKPDGVEYYVEIMTLLLTAVLFRWLALASLRAIDYLQYQLKDATHDTRLSFQPPSLLLPVPPCSSLLLPAPPPPPPPAPLYSMMLLPHAVLPAAGDGAAASGTSSGHRLCCLRRGLGSGSSEGATGEAMDYTGANGDREERDTTPVLGGQTYHMNVNGDSASFDGEDQGQDQDPSDLSDLKDHHRLLGAGKSSSTEPNRRTRTPTVIEMTLI